jgi:hypothetical protein
MKVTWKQIILGVLVATVVVAIIIGVLAGTGGGHSHPKGLAATPVPVP